MNEYCSLCGDPLDVVEMFQAPLEGVPEEPICEECEGQLAEEWFDDTYE